MTVSVGEILGWYGADNAGTLTNRAQQLNQRRFKGGAGKPAIQSIDRGFEHGLAPSFASNPPIFNPQYHFELAIKIRCRASETYLGFIEDGGRENAREIPLTLKTSDAGVRRDEKDPNKALAASIQDALRLGCCAIKVMIDEGSAHLLEMFGQLHSHGSMAKRNGLVVVLRSSPCRANLSKVGASAMDGVGCAIQIPTQPGAHIIRMELPTAHVEQKAARKVYDKQRPRWRPRRRGVLKVLECPFADRRIATLSFDVADSNDGKRLDVIRTIYAGGGFGFVMRHHCIQRRKAYAIPVFCKIMNQYASPASRGRSP
jgi:class I fructose-bisphosphate aldolase